MSPPRNSTLYQSIAMSMRTEIRSGHWKVGDRIPTIAELAEEYNVSIVTIRSAISLLQHEGVLSVKHGKGTYVASNRTLKPWIHLESNWDELLSIWRHTTITTLSENRRVQAPDFSADHGSLDASYHFFNRLHSIEGVPYAVLSIYIADSYYSMEPERFASEMAVIVLEDLGQSHVSSIHQTLTIEAASSSLAQLLSIEKDAPIGRVTRLISDSSGMLSYIGIAQYRGDVVTLETSFRR